MKKTTILLMVMVFFLSAISAAAKENKKNIDFSKPIEDEKAKIEIKGTLSSEEREILEEKLKGEVDVSLKNASKRTPTMFTGATGILGEPLTLGAKKYAVLIGLSNYVGITNDLCVNRTSESNLDNECRDGDAVNMEKTLVEKYNYDPLKIQRFSDSGAEFYAIESAIKNNLRINVTPEDEVVFFFSGHAAISSTDVDGDGEAVDEGIVLYNGDIIWDGQLKEWFSGFPAKRIVFVFDTCKAGGMDDLAGPNRVLALSSGENQYSYTYYLGGENGYPGEGMFSHYFNVNGMFGGLADGYNALGKKSSSKYDGKVAVEEAFSYAKKYVPVMTSNNQIPAMNDKFTNDLLPGY